MSIDEKTQFNFKCPECQSEDIGEVRAVLPNDVIEIVQFCYSCNLILIDSDHWLEHDDIIDFEPLH